MLLFKMRMQHWKKGWDFFRNIFVLKCFLKRVRKSLFFFFLQHWEVFKKVTEVFILVPALLGLKGNLEMTLASRLSTAVSLFPASKYVCYQCCFPLLRRTCIRKIFFPLSDKFLDLRAVLSSYAWYDTLGSLGCLIREL